MRKLFIAAAMAAATATASMPASAQNWRLQASTQREIQTDINQLDRQITRAAQRRTISSREATVLRKQASTLQRTYNSFSRNGLTRQEVQRLETQVNQLRHRLKLERRDWDGRRN